MTLYEESLANSFLTLGCQAIPVPNDSFMKTKTKNSRNTVQISRKNLAICPDIRIFYGILVINQTALIFLRREIVFVEICPLDMSFDEFKEYRHRWQIN